VVSDLFDDFGSFLHDFGEPILRPLHIRVINQHATGWIAKLADLDSVHLVNSDNKLLDSAKAEGKKNVLASLTALGYTSLEFTGSSGNNEDSTISLRCTGHHVLDEIMMAWSVNKL
jgi:hypothetical protein